MIHQHPASQPPCPPRSPSLEEYRPGLQEKASTSPASPPAVEDTEPGGEERQGGVAGFTQEPGHLANLLFRTKNAKIPPGKMEGVGFHGGSGETGTTGSYSKMHGRAPQARRDPRTSDTLRAQLRVWRELCKQRKECTWHGSPNRASLSTRAHHSPGVLLT